MTRITPTAPAASGVLIVGGGLAGQRCAETLRREGFAQPIRILCAESHRPYDRPPLSKELLTGAGLRRELAFRAPEWYEQSAVELTLGVSAVRLLPAEHRVELSSGATVRYDRLLIATGSRPRRLELLRGYENVSELRTLEDAVTLRGRLREIDHLVLVGAGFVGLEIAASARALGVAVTLVEALPVPLGHVLGPELGRWFTALHERHGVRVITGCSVARASARGGRIAALTLSDETTVTGDHVVLGIGSEPATDWLAGSGLDPAHAVRVDACGRSRIGDIWAAGDAAATFDPRLRRHVTGSHWEQAARQGARAALAMLGRDPGPAPLTSFWTDQYGIRIQYLGRSAFGDLVRIDGDPGASRFTATFLREGRVVAALLVDRPSALPAARRMIEHQSGATS